MLQKLIIWCNGRTTLFTVGFFIAGNLMHWFHRLDATYITYMGTLLGAVIGHSFKDDKHEQAMKDNGNGGDNAGK